MLIITVLRNDSEEESEEEESEEEESEEEESEEEDSDEQESEEEESEEEESDEEELMMKIQTMAPMKEAVTMTAATAMMLPWPLLLPLLLPTKSSNSTHICYQIQQQLLPIQRETKDVNSTIQQQHNNNNCTCELSTTIKSTLKPIKIYRVLCNYVFF